MRIEEIHVDGFGLMHGRVVHPDPGLTVVRGLNEAGKTTLLSFIRAILFGFDGRGYRAMAGGRRGGWLSVRSRDGRAFRIERYGDAGGQGRVRVVDEHDKELGSGELALLLQGVDQQLFRNVFAFGLAELAEFKKLTDEQVTARIYGAGLALGPVSPLEIEANLLSECENLFKPGGHNPTVNAILKALEAVDGELRDLNLPANHAEAVGDLATHEARLLELRDAIAAASDEGRRLGRLRDAWEPWVTMRGDEAARSALGDVAILPPGLAERLGVLEARADTSRARLTELTRRREGQEIALSRIDVDDAVIACRAEIEELARAAQRDRASEKELASVTEQIRQAERERDDTLLRLGTGWTAERVAAFDDSVTVHSEITGHLRERLDRASGAVAQALARRAQASRELGELSAEHELIAAESAEIAAAEAAEPALEDQERAIAVLGTAIADRERAAARAAAATAEAQLAADGVSRTDVEVAEEQRAARSLRDGLLETRQAEALLASLPDGEAAAPGAASGSLVAAVIAGPAVAAAVIAVVVGIPPLGGALIGGVGLVGAGLVWYLLTRQGKPSPAPATATARASLQQRAAASRTETATLAARLGLAADAPLGDVDTALERLATEERSLARIATLREAAERVGEEAAAAEAGLERASRAAGLKVVAGPSDVDRFNEQLRLARDRRARRLGLDEQASGLTRRIEGLARTADDAGRQVAEAEAEDAAARSEWSAWLSAHDLDAGLDRETAKTVIDAVTAAKRPLRTLSTLLERLRALAADHGAFVDIATATAARAGLARPRPTDRSSIDKLVADLESLLDGALEADSSHDVAADSLEGLVREEAQARADAEIDQNELDKLLADCGTPDAAALRSALTLSDQARALDSSIAAGRRTLTTLSGPGEALDGLLGDLGSVAEVVEIEARLEDVEARRGDLESEQGELREEAGSLRDRIAAMERDVAATEKRQLREDLLGQLSDAAERWSVAAIARHLLRQSRETYEAAHRPAVIETAERYFAEWTAGRYRRIVAPLGRQIEAVEHRDGTQVAIGDLSTGTAQQLYLAIRFGLVEHFSEAAEPLPVVMDDILVNFDDERAAFAARSIEDLARRHQVIYFTCHPETPLAGGLEVSLDRLETVQQSVAVG